LNDYKQGSLRLIRRLPVVVYYGDSIFEYEYLREYKDKIEKTLHGVGGPWAVSESIDN